MAGPIRMPRPDAAPSIPIPWARSWGPVESATYAWATEMVPPAAPAAMRETKRAKSDSASPKIMYETADAKRPAMMNGRRPRRSEIRPQIGTAMNCMAEKEAISSVTSSGEAPNSSA